MHKSPASDSLIQFSYGKTRSLATFICRFPPVEHPNSWLTPCPLAASAMVPYIRTVPTSLT